MEVFKVRAARSGIEVDVPDDRSIAEMLAEAGVPVDVACEEGVCGMCLTNIIEGIPDHRDFYLDAVQERTDAHMTICCSRAKTPLLILDI